jgi:hypothetical protein
MTSVCFRWSLDKFSSREGKCVSEVFSAGPWQWNLIVFPRGNVRVRDYLSFYVAAVKATPDPNQPNANRYSDVRHVKITFFLDKPGQQKAHKMEEPARVIGIDGVPDWGIHSFMGLDKLQDYVFGDDKLVLGVEISICPFCLSDEHKPIEPPPYSSHYLSLVNSDEFSDVSFVFPRDTAGTARQASPSTAATGPMTQDRQASQPQQTVLYGHKNILCAVSPYFRAMFTGPFAESGERQITITDCEPGIFMILMEHLYTGATARLGSLCLEQLKTLAQVSDMYGVSALHSSCNRQIESMLNAENAIQILLYAIESAPEMISNVTDWAKYHWSLIRKSPSLSEALSCGNVELMNRLLDIAQSAAK